MTIFFDIHQNEVKLPLNEKIFWRISAYTIVEEKGKILLVRPKWYDKTWTLPGGGIEEKETIKEGIERECYEETGYRIDVDISKPIHFGESNFYDEKKFFHSLNFVFIAKLKSHDQDSKAINQDEIAKIEWIPKENINEKNCHFIMYPGVDNFNNGRHIT